VFFLTATVFLFSAPATANASNSSFNCVIVDLLASIFLFKFSLNTCNCDILLPPITDLPCVLLGSFYGAIDLSS
jgi:hypothetical protein